MPEHVSRRSILKGAIATGLGVVAAKISRPEAPAPASSEALKETGWWVQQECERAQAALDLVRHRMISVAQAREMLGLDDACARH